jgi:thiosulfate/3-mercaptopyruvate sulfurtransferase
MSYTTLVTVPELNLHIADDNWAVVDCRFSLGETERGRRDYLQAHIPKAVYAHLNEDLSGTVITGKTGRHPLPSVALFTEILANWGIASGIQVVVYDDAGGAIAARLWWMLNWVGHEEVALLDGGWQAWQSWGLPVASGREYRPRKHFEAHARPEATVDAGRVEEIRNDPHHLLLDARSAVRFRGEVEPIDPVAGHIPGAVSAPYEENLTPEGTFLPPETLRRHFENLLKAVPSENVICYCGSGVTAAHNLLALAHAGLGRGRLYAGSWSEWITVPGRPVAKG